MKSVKTYIPCLLLSFIMVFALLGTSTLVTLNKSFSSENLTQLADENQVVPKIKEEINKHFSSEYNETGIPAEVYTSAITDEYIDFLVKKFSREGVLVLKENWKFDYTSGTKNAEMEGNITEFFENYAKETGYEKDEKYEKKLAQTISKAYDVILEYCDIYKMKTLDSEGILFKVSPIFQDMSFFIIIAIAFMVLLIILLLTINHKAVFDGIYWIGASSLTAGIIGIVPCIYLNCTNFFDSFVIKQQQIFTSFTSLMHETVNDFMIKSIILCSMGLLIILIYAFMGNKNKV